LIADVVQHGLQQWWAPLAAQANLNGPRTNVPAPAPEELEKKHYRN